MDRNHLDQLANKLHDTMLYRRYIEGGGTPNDFATDLEYVLTAWADLSLTELCEQEALRHGHAR